MSYVKKGSAWRSDLISELPESEAGLIQPTGAIQPPVPENIEDYMDAGLDPGWQSGLMENWKPTQVPSAKRQISVKQPTGRVPAPSVPRIKGVPPSPVKVSKNAAKIKGVPASPVAALPK